ncbi:YjfK family protein [Vibrio penaeicida]|uniref:YjfK family protein n=1 Tax=Vibrio penaeicida TaxID=104609 RepID=UPI002736B3B9|nr:YjfK family protein [Vibrio penaeicida]MDP2574122.1 YjfK family protein [Vibrio penaeicida]
MFDWFKKKTEKAEEKPNAPEVLGLRLGGAFELDDLKFRMLEPELTIDGASRTQLIQAVGEVKLDSQTTLLRYYTDDDGYIQVLLNGEGDSGVLEVKLFYFYETKSIDLETTWNRWIETDLVQPSQQLDDHEFSKVWDNDRPVAMTEKTYHSNGKVSETDQFIMLYERDATPDLAESLVISCEESFESGSAERCVTYITGVDLSPTDFTVIG